jgi:4-hydroxybenzoate polyprenyltransferase
MSLTKALPYRLAVYFTERFPVLVYIPFSIILYLCLSFLVQLISGVDPVFDQYGVAGCLTAFLFMLLIRTFDDIKDVDLDHDIFPDRPVSRGAVLIKDVYGLAIFSFCSLVAINVLVAPNSIWVFVGVMIYALGTFKYFFAEELHIRKPVVAMITHQPLPLSIVFVLIHISLASGPEYNSFEVNHLFLLLTFALPVTAWEVSRKIKAPSQEIERYATFSRILGPKGASAIPLILYVISAGASVFLARHLDLHSSYFVLIGFYLLVVSYAFVRFIAKPIPDRNILKNVAMIYTGLFMLTLLVYVFVRYQDAILS